jgi:hypothetical protein
MKDYINTDTYIFLVVFQTTTSKFICDGSKAVVKCLKENDKHNTLKYIKVFEPSKEKFTRASKERLTMLLMWDAESTEYLSKHYYFQ